jgi:hypothetical protein
MTNTLVVISRLIISDEPTDNKMVLKSVPGNMSLQGGFYVELLIKNELDFFMLKRLYFAVYIDH